MASKERPIRVALTRAQWRALYRTAVGELESLSEMDERNGVGDDLREAIEAMEAARRKAAKR